MLRKILKIFSRDGNREEIERLQAQLKTYEDLSEKTVQIFIAIEEQAKIIEAQITALVELAWTQGCWTCKGRRPEHRILCKGCDMQKNWQPDLSYSQSPSSLEIN